MHKFTKDQGKFIADNVKGLGNKELTERFNKHFKLSLGVNQIKAYKKNNKLSSELNGQFKKGHIPANKGTKGLHKGGVATQFKKGNTPHNHMPVGTERINGDDYVDIKIAEPNKWRGKHILVWEEHNGPVPEGHAVIFGDGNNRNFEIDNLICVSRRQLLKLNRYKLIKNNADLTRTGVIIADLHQKISEVKQ